jgi:hypothetical protein
VFGSLSSRPCYGSNRALRSESRLHLQCRPRPTRSRRTQARTQTCRPGPRGHPGTNARFTRHLERFDRQPSIIVLLGRDFPFVLFVVSYARISLAHDRLRWTSGTAAPRLRDSTVLNASVQVIGRRLAGIGIGSAGTKVATETCGQLRPAIFRMTFWVYWICVAAT